MFIGLYFNTCIRTLFTFICLAIQFEMFCFTCAIHLFRWFIVFWLVGAHQLPSILLLKVTAIGKWICTSEWIHNNYKFDSMQSHGFKLTSAIRFEFYTRNHTQYNRFQHFLLTTLMFWILWLIINHDMNKMLYLLLLLFIVCIQSRLNSC